tara:strand:+ start:1914 stop:3905 length:1992 start_codon:yes stop_codon:yes gene_type:complete
MRLTSIFSITLIRKIIYLGLTLTTVFCLSYILSKQTPLAGDEFYTLDIKQIFKPIPYQYIVSEVIDSINQIKPSHTFNLRSTSIFFTCIGIILLIVFFPKTKLELFLLSILIITNPFILAMSIFFRYYSYYFMSSILAFIFLVILYDRFNLKNKIFIGILGSIGSIFFLYVLNALQFGLAILKSVIMELVKDLRIRKIIITTITLLFISIVFNPKIIWQLFYTLKITGHAAVNIDAIEILGLSNATLIKPFYAVYQMIFGLDIAPTYSIYTLFIFIFIAIIFLFVLWRIWCDKKKLFFNLLLHIIIPFFLIYYFFQALSLPGATQLEPKHGMLIFPVIFYLAIKSHNYLSPVMHIIFMSALVTAQLSGMVKSFNKQNTDWNKIAIQSHVALSEIDDGAILMDGRSREIYNFYSQDNVGDYPIYYTWENTDSLLSKLLNRSKLVLLLSDYKSYTNLSLRQNWNAGTSSESRFIKLQELLKYFNYHFKIKDSYVSYPTFYYVLEKKEIPNKVQSFSVWKHHLKDLKLPIQSDNSMLLSSVLVNEGERVSLQNDSIIIFNLENISSHNTFGDTIGIIESNFQKKYLIYRQNSWDIFSDYHGINPNNKSVFYSWEHEPLISGSINYAGSFSKHKSKLFKINLDKKSDMISITNTSKSSKIRVWSRKL